MKTSNTQTEKRIIVAFHIGLGGRFNNQGHKSFMGEKNFQDLINLNSGHMFYYDRDERGRFITPTYTDGSGNRVTESDVNGEVGILDFDGQYDTDIACYIEDCDQQELQMIKDSGVWMSYELSRYIEENLVEEEEQV